jgi:hypothetical protein
MKELYMKKINYPLMLNRIYVSLITVISVIDLIQTNILNAGIHLALGNILITLPAINDKTLLRLSSIAVSLTIIFILVLIRN